MTGQNLDFARIQIALAIAIKMDLVLRFQAFMKLLIN